MKDTLTKIDPRIKIVSTFFFIFFAVTGNQNILQFSLLFFILFTIGVFLKLSFLSLFKRTLVIIPFVVLVAIFLPFFGGGETIEVFQIHLSTEGLKKFADILMKAFLSVFCAALLVESTEFQDLLKGFEKLKMPTIMVIIISFTYRYFLVILEEAQRMKRARDLRSINHGFIWQVKTFGNILGQLFLRSYERSERVYQAMVLRGFSGEIKTLNTFCLKDRDLALGMGFCIIVVGVWVVV
jgi:cobalt/nickel transport system permease protein